MPAVAISSHGAELLQLLHPRIFAPRARKASTSIKIRINSNFRDISKRVSLPPTPLTQTHQPPTLKFNKLQPSDQELKDGIMIDFDQLLAREAQLDEELWAAAWLRAASHWEDRVNDRYAHSYKKKFAEQEFNALRKQCKGHNGQNFKCIVVVKQQHDMMHTAIKSVLGTLDLSFRYLLQGETFPGEKVKAPLFCSINMAEKTKYAYVANVCVAKAARRQGIASIMMRLAIELTRTNGLAEVYVHVHRKNVAAQGMYHKMGFETKKLVLKLKFKLCRHVIDTILHARALFHSGSESCP
ncbi:hypothetical protein QQ045_025183 [Rhodiola kirilowii]